MKKLIMIIDDSTTVRKIIVTCLGREGFSVVGFPDGVGSHALALAAQCAYVGKTINSPHLAHKFAS